MFRYFLVHSLVRGFSYLVFIVILISLLFLHSVVKATSIYDNVIFYQDIIYMPAWDGTRVNFEDVSSRFIGLLKNDSAKDSLLHTINTHDGQWMVVVTTDALLIIWSEDQDTKTGFFQAYGMPAWGIDAGMSWNIIKLYKDHDVLYQQTYMNQTERNTVFMGDDVSLRQPNTGLVFSTFNNVEPVDYHGASVGVKNNTLDYLALGDSYSSGEGDTELNANGKKFYRSGTDVNDSDTNPKEKCHVSSRSYPYLLADDMALGGPSVSPLTRWQSVACSGATMWDVVGQASTRYEGQGKRLLGFNQYTLKQEALNEFIPGRQKQIEFVRQYKPKVITLTMGGNDIGFGEKMRLCALSVDTCEFATQSGSARFAKQINDQFDSLKSLYEELFNASGRSSKIFVVGYPQFINSDKNASCNDMNIGFINGDEREAIGRSVSYLNNVIEQAAQAAGVKYIDIEDSLDGHRLCDSNSKYVTGIALLTPSETQESYHPNAKGHYEMAKAIRQKVNHQSLMDYSWCNEGNKNCPSIDITKDSVPGVAGFPLDRDTQLVIYRQLTALFARKGESTLISLPENSMKPGSEISINLRGVGVEIGKTTANPDGSVNANLTIPMDVPVGPHLIEVNGKDSNNLPVVNEQVIDIHGPNPSDIDDNGVDDVSDGCLFISVINRDEDNDGIDDACDPDISEPLPTVTPTPSPSVSPSPSPTPSPSPNPSISPSPSSSPSISPSPSPAPQPDSPPTESIVSLVKKIVITIIKIIIKVVVSLFK